MLIVWGKNDQIFPAAGAEPYKRDLKTLEFHLLDAGHFALETERRRDRQADAGVPRQARGQAVMRCQAKAEEFCRCTSSDNNHHPNHGSTKPRQNFRYISAEIN